MDGNGRGLDYSRPTIPVLTWRDRDTTTYLMQDNRSSSQDFNPGLSEYKAS
jgi:hypothetical protein